MLPILWDGTPPSLPRLGIQVFTVPKGATVFARLLDRWVGTWLHWLPHIGPRGRSLPCHGEQCPWCPDPFIKWYGYSPALVWRVTSGSPQGDWQPQALELTECAVQPLRELRTVAGLVVQLKREKRVNGKLELTILEQATLRGGKQLAPLPAPFDVRPILERIWGRCGLAAAGEQAEASEASESLPAGAVVPFAGGEPPTNVEEKERSHKAATPVRSNKRRKHL